MFIEVAGNTLREEAIEANHFFADGGVGLDGISPR